jgi:hypothetical protein
MTVRLEKEEYDGLSARRKEILRSDLLSDIEPLNDQNDVSRTEGKYLTAHINELNGLSFEDEPEGVGLELGETLA